MYRRYRLEPLTGAHRPIEFEWDAGAGELRGPDADQVRQLAQDAKRAGEVIGHPYPTAHRVSDPLRRPEEMAVVLGNAWRLDGELATAYPIVPTDEDGRADGDGVYDPDVMH